MEIDRKSMLVFMNGKWKEGVEPTDSDKDKMLDGFHQRGLDELQKFFDGGGKLDFSEVGSVDEIADLVRSGFEKISDDPLTFRTDYKNIGETPDFDLKKIDDFKNNYSAVPFTHKRNEHFDYPSDVHEKPISCEFKAKDTMSEGIREMIANHSEEITLDEIADRADIWLYPEYVRWLAEEIEAGRLPPPLSDVVKMSEAGKRGAVVGRELAKMVGKFGIATVQSEKALKALGINLKKELGPAKRFYPELFKVLDDGRRWYKPWTWSVWGWFKNIGKGVRFQVVTRFGDFRGDHD